VVRDLGARGEGVVATDEVGVVLVPGVFPGERVRVRLTGRRRGVRLGVVDEVVAPSPDRRPPACPLASGACGGCPWMSWALPRQWEEKRVRVARAVGLPPDQVPLHVGVEGGLGYRRRARLHFVAPRPEDPSPRRPRLGYRQPRSKAVVDVEACPVLAPPLADALGRMRGALLPRLRGRGEVALGLGAGGRPVARVTTDTPQPAEVYRTLDALVADGDGFAGVALDLAGVVTRFGAPETWAPGFDGRPLRAASGGFTQAQDEVNAALAHRVRDLAAPGGARVLELYAGHGNLTVPLAQEARGVVAGERDDAAVAAARDNLAERGLADRVRLVLGDALDVLRGLARADAPEVAVLDPPRRGAGADVLSVLADLRPARVVLVSCEPVALARDVETLRDRGYAVDAAEAFDMFPHTPHVEAAVRLS